MKKWMMIMLSLMFLVVLQRVSSADTDNLVAYWSFDSDTTDEQGSNDASNSGATVAAGKLGNAYDFEETESDYMSIAYSNLPDNDEDYTILAWVKPESISGEDLIYSIGSASSKSAVIFGINDGYLRMNHYGYDDTSANASINASEWAFIGITYDSTSNIEYYYINGQKVDFRDTADLTISNSDPSISKVAYASSSYFDGIIDELQIYSADIGEDRISALYNSGTGCNPLTDSCEVSTSPSATLSTDLIAYSNHTADLTFHFNASLTNISTDSWTCELYLNDTLNETKTTLCLNATGGSCNQNFTLTYAEQEAGYDVNVTCNRTDQGVAVYTSFLRQDVFIDNIQPALTIELLANNSVYNQGINASTFQVNGTGSDTNLFAMNFTILNSTDHTIFNKFVTDINTTTFSNYTTINFDNYPEDQYRYRLQAWDAHNPVHFEHEQAENISEDLGKLTIKFNKGKIEVLSNDVKKFKVYDEDNKYRVEYKFEKYEGNVIYVDEADKWHLVSTTGHKAHLVNLGLNKYFDMDHDAITVRSVTQEDGMWKIVVDTEELTVKTHSIGDLNNNTLTYYFNITVAKLNILLYDEETDEYITEAQAIEIIGATGAYISQSTITGGSLSLTELPVDTYTIRYCNESYATRAYFVTTTDDTTNITLFGIKNDTADTIVITVIDEKGQGVSNATVKAKRQFVKNREGAYLVVEMEKTDSNGDTVFYLEGYDTYYMFLVENSAGTVIFTSDEQKITASQVYLRANTLSNPLSAMDNEQNISRTLTYDNDTGKVSYTWNDASGNMQQACLEIYEETVLAKTKINSSCATSASGTINLYPILSNDTRVYAQGFVRINPYFPDYIDIFKSKSWETYGDEGLFLSYFFIVTMFFAGVMINFSVGLVYSVVSMGLLQIFGVTFFGWALIITVTIIGLIIAVKHRI